METRPDQNTIVIEAEMRQSYMDYAMSVIIGRALPDVRDGLKPVHRRVLYAMQDLANDWNRPYKKSARVVGDVIGKYHPHGDAAVYDTIVRMAQDFSLRYPLVDGQGNFGSVDGDAAAAMRYTEIRMARIASELLADLDSETVDFAPNYDDSTTEPLVLPTKLPNLLLNGSTGIAVGMSTNIPPHNLREVVAALLALIESPDLTVDELMQYLPGPDFPTGAFIYGTSGIRQAYNTGRGIIQMRADTCIETDARTGKNIVVATAIPFQVNKARLIERIADLVNEKRIEGISDLRDESDRHGMRIVVELKRDAVPEIVQNQLYKLTSLQESYGIIMLAIDEGRPVLMNLKELLVRFLDHRRVVIQRRTQYQLRKARARLHLLAGLKIALDNLDAILQIIRSGQDPASVRATLQTRFVLSTNQAQAILDMRLQRLTQLEREKMITEHLVTARLITQLHTILVNPHEIDAMMQEELSDLRTRYGDDRRTQIVETISDLSDEDLIAKEDMVVTISHAGYIKRTPVSEYRSQRRGGRGVVGATTRTEDFVEHIFVSSSHDVLLYFTSTGKVHWLKVYQIPSGGRTARGTAIVNLLPLQAGEKVSAFLPVREFGSRLYVIFATKTGQVKKTELAAYARQRAGGIIAISLNEGDELIGVRLTDGSGDIVLSSKGGHAIRFAAREVRPTGRDTSGVRGLMLDAGDELVSLEIAQSQEDTLFTLSSLGYGKRTKIAEYRRQTRGGKGILTLRITEKTGSIVAVRLVCDEDHLLLVTDSGRIIRLRAAEIRVIGRNTQGVRLVTLNAAERVSGLALASSDDDSDTASAPADNDSAGA